MREKTTRRFPAATHMSHAAVQTDFIFAGAYQIVPHIRSILKSWMTCEYAISSPGMEIKISAAVITNAEKELQSN